GHRHLTQVAKSSGRCKGNNGKNGSNTEAAKLSGPNVSTREIHRRGDCSYRGRVHAGGSSRGFWRADGRDARLDQARREAIASRGAADIEPASRPGDWCALYLRDTDW